MSAHNGVSEIDDPPLTPRQLQLFELIQAGIDAGLPPTRYELAEAMGVYQNAVTDMLLILERKGYIELVAAIARGIRIKRLPGPATATEEKP